MNPARPAARPVFGWRGLSRQGPDKLRRHQAPPLPRVCAVGSCAVSRLDRRKSRHWRARRSSCSTTRALPKSRSCATKTPAPATSSRSTRAHGSSIRSARQQGTAAGLHARSFLRRPWASRDDRCRLDQPHGTPFSVSPAASGMCAAAGFRSANGCAHSPASAVAPISTGPTQSRRGSRCGRFWEGRASVEAWLPIRSRRGCSVRSSRSGVVVAGSGAIVRSPLQPGRDLLPFCASPTSGRAFLPQSGDCQSRVRGGAVREPASSGRPKFRSLKVRYAVSGRDASCRINGLAETRSDFTKTL